MKKLTVGAASLAAALATTQIGSAEDADGADGPIAVAMAADPGRHDWTGPYVGAQLGLSDIALENAGVPGNDGPLAGLHVGYMWDLGSAVLGAEVSYSRLDIEFGGGISSIDYFADLQFRAGYDFGTGLLVYGTAGVKRVAVDTPIGQLRDQGPLFGFGLAYDLGTSWVIGGEITYMQIDDFDGSGAEPDFTTATARLSYRF